jgi:hypothetical protein
MRGDAWGCVGMCGELLGGASAAFAASARLPDPVVPWHILDLHTRFGVHSWIFWVIQRFVVL